MITAAMESSSARLPDVGEPALSRPEVMIAATPASRPHNTYTETRTHRTGMPVRRAASGLPPVA